MTNETKRPTKNDVTNLLIGFSLGKFKGDEAVEKAGDIAGFLDSLSSTPTPEDVARDFALVSEGLTHMPATGTVAATRAAAHRLRDWAAQGHALAERVKELEAELDAALLKAAEEKDARDTAERLVVGKNNRIGVLASERDALQARVKELEREKKELRDHLDVEAGLRKDMRAELAEERKKRIPAKLLSRAEAAERKVAEVEKALKREREDAKTNADGLAKQFWQTEAVARRYREALSVLREVEWQRVDWQGFCVFRRAVGCQGTDGHVSAMGTPRPKPHSETCPFFRIEALTSSRTTPPGDGGEEAELPAFLAAVPDPKPGSDCSPEPTPPISPGLLEAVGPLAEKVREVESEPRSIVPPWQDFDWNIRLRSTEWVAIRAAYDAAKGAVND